MYSGLFFIKDGERRMGLPFAGVESLVEFV